MGIDRNQFIPDAADSRLGQHSLRTTLPRRPAAVKGCELSHAVALRREGNSPSMGIGLNGTAPGVICRTAPLSSANIWIGAPIAPTSSAASKSWLDFMMDAF